MWSFLVREALGSSDSVEAIIRLYEMGREWLRRCGLHDQEACRQPRRFNEVPSRLALVHCIWSFVYCCEAQQTRWPDCCAKSGRCNLETGEYCFSQERCDPRRDAAPSSSMSTWKPWACRWVLGESLFWAGALTPDWLHPFAQVLSSTTNAMPVGTWLNGHRDPLGTEWC